MKILHFSDTHLGYNDLNILNENNINQREADNYDAFSQVVAQIKLINILLYEKAGKKRNI